MLTQLYIKNFTIIEELDIELPDGLNIITGKTGAGKSIVIDALELVLGERADSNAMRQGETRTEISASFDISKNIPVQQWLKAQEIESDACILRRIINDGRSKLSVNGTPTTASQLKQLAELLINIHGQHQHQSLLKRDYQLQLLDDFANVQSTAKQTKQLYSTWHTLQQQLANIKKQAGEKDSRIQLLEFQLRELEELNLSPHEAIALHQEYKRLNNAESLINSCQTALNVLTDDDEQSATHQLNYALTQFASNEQLKNCCELINSAVIQTEEAANELRHYLDRLEINPERLQKVEQRLDKIHDTARKYRVEPEILPQILENITQELDQLKNAKQHIAELEERLKKTSENYLITAKKLTEQRKKSAKLLSQAIQEKMQQLGMPGGKFSIELEPNKDNHFAAYGLERVNFMVSANPGQPLQSLNKVASGGELSRISLAIQVITAQTTTTPTLIFDEVDVGIGGDVAEIVGKLLRELGQKAQIICITHLPQVAAQGHYHFQVQKQTGSKTTTQLIALTPEQRANEIARMLGGVKITEKTLDHAKEMLGAQV